MDAKELRKLALDTTLSKIVERLLEGVLILAGLGVVWFVSTGKANGVTPVGWAAIGTGAVAVAGLAVAIWVRRRSVYRYRYPKVKFHYEVLSKKTVYIINNRDELEFVRQYKIKVLHGPLEEFLDRYIWTGGPTPLPEGGPNLLRVERLLRVGIWTYIRATFRRPLLKGEIYEFEIRWPPITNWRSSSPFVSTSTEEPTHELSFELTIPSGEIGGTTILAEELRGIEATFPFKTKEVPFVNGHCVWTVKRPPLYRHYRLRWEWTGSVQTVSQALESGTEGESNRRTQKEGTGVG